MNNIFGLEKNTWKKLLRYRNQTVDAIGRDEFFRKGTGAKLSHTLYNKLHPVQDITYKFNSWGLRDDVNYEQYYKQKVILCIGDSFTINTGGRLEDSWPKLLQKYFDIPVLNMGITSIASEGMILVIEKMQQYFDVQHTVVMFNMHGDKLVEGNWGNWGNRNKIFPNFDREVLKFLKEFISYNRTHVAFIPPWAWGPEHMKILYEYFPNAHAYLKDIDFKYADIPLNLFSIIIGNDYKSFSNKKWPTIEQIYYQLVKTNDLGDLMDKKDSYFFLRHIYPKVKRYFYTNRDTRHFSRIANQMVADYFYFKCIGIEPPIKEHDFTYLSYVSSEF